MPVARKIQPGAPSSSPPSSSSLPPSVAPLLGTAHLVVLSAPNDPSSQNLIASTLANAAAGAPDAIAVAQVFEHAAKVANRAKYVRTWLFGDGAAKVRGR